MLEILISKFGEGHKIAIDFFVEVGKPSVFSCLERFSLDCHKTKTKVNTLANQRA